MIPVKTRVSLFVTCIVDQVFPQVGIAMTQVLERLGYQVDFPRRADLLRAARVQQRISRGSGARWRGIF